MRKIFVLIAVSLLLIKPAFSQQDQFSFLNQSEVTKFAEPLATSLGVGLNTGGFHSADIPSLWGFSIGIHAMYIFVPNDQMTFTPNLPPGYSNDQPTATFWGDKGTIYSGPNGYITYPNGINQTSVPFAIPQVTASFMGTEVLVRYLPNISVGDRDIKFFGFGLRHSISRYIPLIPVDVAVQFLYNKITVTDLIDANAIAFNGEVSKSFGLLTVYGGLQYETAKFDLSYTLKGDPNSGDPTLRQDKKIDASVTGKDHVRFIIGSSVNLAFIVLNIDYNLTSQSALAAGLTFEL